jgi:chromosome segregation ATPase
MAEPSNESASGSNKDYDVGALSNGTAPPTVSVNLSHPSHQSSTSTAASAAAAGGGGSGGGGTKKATAASLSDANEELSQLIIAGKISSDDVFATKSILNDYTGLKEKVEKLKSLLGRSAKAQREAKVDLDASQKRLTSAMKEIERLHQKLDKLQTRPSRECFRTV